MSDFDIFKSSIVRIFKKKEEKNFVIGTGFFISQQHFLTCAHVIKEALDLDFSDLRQVKQVPQESITFDFPFYQLNEPLTAKVIFWNPCSSEKITDAQWGEDVACLEIQENLPLQIQPIKLESSDNIDGHNLKIYGFPEQAGKKGMSAEGILKGRIAEGWIELQPTEKRAITGGFSGAPIWRIWDVDKSKCVGMTVASSRKEEDELAFGISNEVLINDCLKFVELYSLLKTETQDLKSIIKETYLKVRPQFWSDSNPKEIYEIVPILNYLHNMPQTNQGEIPLDKFVVNLVANLGLNNPISLKLKEWGKNNINNFETLVDKEIEINQAQPNKKQGYIVLVIHPSIGNKRKYIISGLVITKNLVSNLSNQKQEIVLEEKLGLEIENEEELLNIEKVEKTLENIVEDLIIKSKDYILSLEEKPNLVCFLPRKLLTESINNFKVTYPNDDDEEEDDNEEKITLGIYLSVIVRSYQRLAKKYKNQDKLAQWKAKWSTLSNNCSGCCSNVFTLDDGLDYDNYEQIYATLIGNEIKGLMLTKNPSNSLLKFINNELIPACIWVRNNYNDPNLKEELKEVLKCSISELPTKMTEKHREAINKFPKSPEKHLGHHLSLLLDDPNLLPTKINYS